ncbi:MAG TPA: tetratricopeptide repeat protein [Methylomirabilota bacterium]|nr:tetratricopeptide repeat protein [Methylomirabilota bacterium]
MGSGGWFGERRARSYAAALDQARAELASGAFAAAQSRAEAVLRDSPPSEVKASALIVAGDAAYGLGAYQRAVERYTEALQSDELPAEAPRATLARGWAELRLGRREDARLTWVQVSRQFPNDSHAPIALIQAAELSAQAGDLFVARTLLDRVLDGYAASPEAEIARLSRSVVSMAQGRIPEAVRDLHALARSSRPSLAFERKQLLDELAAAPRMHAGTVLQLVLYRTEVGALNGRPPVETGAAPQTESAFGRLAEPFLDGAGDPRTTPLVLHGLALAATEDKAWSDVDTLTGDLFAKFPSYRPAPDLFVEVADRAAQAHEWQIVRSNYEHARALAPGRGLAPRARVDFAEALARTGAPAEARTELVRFMQEPARPEEAPRALNLLAGVDEALDQPVEALATYERLRRDYPRAEWTDESLLRYARLLQHAVGKQQEARALLQEIVKRVKGEDLSEASFRLGQVLAADGEHRQAVDWYMSAAYGGAERTRWYRPALLGAGASLAASNRAQAALVVYRNLLPPGPLGPFPRDGSPVDGLAGAVEEPQLAAEAAYRIAEIQAAAGQNDEAIDMYLASAALAPQSDWSWRGLVGAEHALVAVGEFRSAAEIYHRVVDSHADAPEIVAAATNALGPSGPATTKRKR